jgi:predicted transcriptional regulator
MTSANPATTVRFSEKTLVDMDRFAKLTKRSRSFIINEAVESYLEDRIAYLADLDAAVTSIDTQPTYSAETVFGWAKTWGTADEKPLAEAGLLEIRK